MPRPTMRWSIPVLALALLAGCATRDDWPPPERPSAPADSGQETEQPDAERATESTRREPESPQPEPRPRPPRTAAEASGPAVIALLQRADEQAGTGELDQAAATVERALNVEPRNPFLYRRLAAIRLAQDQPGQAEALARKSNSLAGDNPILQASNWELIAQARRMRGDNVAADAAAARADYFRGRAGE